MSAVVPKRILIVGFGLLGSAIASAAASQDLEIRVLTKSRTERTSRWDPLVGDAANRDLVLQLSKGIDHIVYAAGGSVPAAAELDPLRDLARALSPLLSVINACGLLGAGLTLLSSGGAVYGNAKTLPIPEDHPTNPISFYGIRNMVVERYVLLQASRLGFNARILRIGNAFGMCPSLTPRGIVAKLLHSLWRDEPFIVYGDGLSVRDYIYAPDVGNAAVQLLSAPPTPAVINIGSGRGHSILALVAICDTITCRKTRIRFDRVRPFEVSANVLDIGRLRQIIEFKPAALELGLRLSWNQMTGRSVTCPQL